VCLRLGEGRMLDDDDDDHEVPLARLSGRLSSLFTHRGSALPPASKARGDRVGQYSTR
jgi:hypothetical protein